MEAKRSEWGPIGRPTSVSRQGGLTLVAGELRSCSLELPWPPTTGNHQHAWTNRVDEAGNRVFATRGIVLKYRTAVSQLILVAGCDWRTLAPVEVMVDLYAPDVRERDMENCEKVLWDAVKCRRKRHGVGGKVVISETPGVFSDDHQIRIKTVRWMSDYVKGGKICLWVRELAC